MADSNFNIPAVIPRVQYLASPGQTAFPIPFPFFDGDDIFVNLGVNVNPEAQNTYTVTGERENTSGTLTFLSGITGGTLVTIYRTSPFQRVVNFQNSGEWQALNVNDQLNRLTTYVQEVALKSMDLALTLPITSQLTGVTVPDEGAVNNANHVIAWNPAGDNLMVGPSIQDVIIGNQLAMDWAIKMDGPVSGGEYSSKYNASIAEGHATAASNSASNSYGYSLNSQAAKTAAENARDEAVAAAAEGLYNEVITITAADSPYTPDANQEGWLFKCNVTSGPITIILDDLADYGEDMKFAFVKSIPSANNVNILGENGLNVTISSEFETHVVVGDLQDNTWLDIVQTTGIPDGSITNAKFVNMAANTVKANNTAGAAAPTDLALAASRILGRGSSGNVAALSVKNGLRITATDVEFATGTVVGRAYAELKTLVTISATIPYDDTIPQVGEGTEILTVSITPKSTTNRLRIRFTSYCSAVNNKTSFAAFLNGAANAIGAVGDWNTASAAAQAYILECEVVPDSTSAQTISIRCGTSDASNVFVNGVSGARRYGGVMRSVLIVEEIVA